jgi:hypothetical protein
VSPRILIGTPFPSALFHRGDFIYRILNAVPCAVTVRQRWYRDDKAVLAAFPVELDRDMVTSDFVMFDAQHRIHLPAGFTQADQWFIWRRIAPRLHKSIVGAL